MNPNKNPFAPGAGARPPELAGRDQVLMAAETALHRIRAGRPEKSAILLGLHGVGKTVLLNRISQQAEEIGYLVVYLEAPEGQRLAHYLAPALRRTILDLSRAERAKAHASRALAALRGFASAFKVSIGDVEISIQDQTADSGNLELDLPELLIATAEAARAGGNSVALFVDEVQYLSEQDLRALIVALHRIAQKNLPLVFFGAGLPQVAALAGDAKSYAERLFEFPDMGPLDPGAASRALREPIQEEGAEIDDDALQRIVALTEGYPYFLQEWGKHAWNSAPSSPIRDLDVTAASAAATQALDRSFFRVRFDRLTPREQEYLRAMAALGAGPHRSGAIADALGVTVESMGPLRNGLIRKGMIWSHAHGATAFTVPMFDQFMLRAMPNWKKSSKPARGKKRR